jgi:hypothetical protein
MRPVTVLAGILLLGISSCKQPDTVPEPNYPANSLTATVSGRPFYAQDMSAALSGGMMAITGITNPSNSKQTSITLTIPHYAGLTTYKIDTANAASYSELGSTYKATSGSITINTANDVHTTGSFTFEGSSGTSTKSITNGTFDLYK